MPTTRNILLALANVQMAAEALFGLDGSAPDAIFSGKLDTAAGLVFLTDGNRRSSKFTTLQAQEFAKIWEVSEHKSNSKTGFSGTLFERSWVPAVLQLGGRFGFGGTRQR